MIILLTIFISIGALSVFMFSNLLGGAIGISLGNTLSKAFSDAFSSILKKKGG